MAHATNVRSSGSREKAGMTTIGAKQPLAADYPGLSGSNVVSHFSDLRDYVGFVARAQLCAGREDTILAYARHLATERSAAPRTVRRRMACLRGFYKDLVRSGSLERSPFAALEMQLPPLPDQQRSGPRRDRAGGARWMRRSRPPRCCAKGDRDGNARARPQSTRNGPTTAHRPAKRQEAEIRLTLSPAGPQPGRGQAQCASEICCGAPSGSSSLRIRSSCTCEVSLDQRAATAARACKVATA